MFLGGKKGKYVGIGWLVFYSLTYWVYYTLALEKIKKLKNQLYFSPCSFKSYTRLIVG